METSWELCACAPGITLPLYARFQFSRTSASASSAPSSSATAVSTSWSLSSAASSSAPSSTAHSTRYMPYGSSGTLGSSTTVSIGAGPVRCTP